MEERTGTFGDIIDRARKTAGLSVEALGEKSGVSKNTISNYINGHVAYPQGDKVRALVDTLIEHNVLPPADRERVIALAFDQTVPPPGGAEEKSERRVPTARIPSMLTSDVPFVGRASDVAHLVAHLASPATSLLVVRSEGRPGMGASRLLGQAAETAGAGRIVWVPCAGPPGGVRLYDPPGPVRLGPVRTGPYGPIIEALRDSLAGDEREGRRDTLDGCAWLIPLLPELIGRDLRDPQGVPWDPSTLPPERRPRAVLAAVARYLTRVAEPDGLVLVCDDMQFADDDTLDLLADLLGVLRPEDRVHLIGASSAHYGLSDPFPRIEGRLRSPNAMIAHDLAPMTDADARLLLADLPGPRIDDADGQRIIAAAAGHPLLLLLEVDALRWQFPETPPADLEQVVRAYTHPLPPRAEWRLDNLLGRLPDTTATVVMAAAKIGDSTHLGLLAAVLEQTRDTIVTTLQPAVDLGLLRVEKGTEDRCTFAHNTIDAFVRRRLKNDHVRDTVTHRRIADALALTRNPDEIYVLAYHARSGHPDDWDVSPLERAGDMAWAQCAYAEAAVYYRDWIEQLGRGAATRGVDRLRAQTKRAQAEAVAAAASAAQ